MNAQPKSETPKSEKPLRIAIGGDHAGFPLKQVIAECLSSGDLGELAGEVVDCGTNSTERCDYPDFAIAVSREILSGKADRGIVVCGSGVGVSVAANKIPGIRAAICHDTYSAHQGVEHDDMNVLCIGGRIIGSELAMEIVRAFLGAHYTPSERHQRRLDKVMEIEAQGIDALDGPQA
ncbi:ribose 5-phosphate isomerase B [Stieleria sp. JC731]|uniref:ribose 5-phosphate isomerase B n=1 Tax=Pirellulaceae TaxID=2691357 RepID=UPI001E2B210F|nr:ribose 5-phosphate isomerase B [Stieleria sp. JC731]MCC9599913.1 ribose 5-phosphate isomerase B [Stieleria sp. JC731]